MVDGVASTVNAVIVPVIIFGVGTGGTQGDAAGVDFTGVTPTLFDLRTVLPYDDDILAGSTMESIDGKYAIGQTISDRVQDPFVSNTVEITGGFPNIGYQLPQHKAAISAFFSFFAPANFPQDFDFREQVSQPQRRMRTKLAAYIYEGVRIFTHYTTTETGSIRVDGGGFGDQTGTASLLDTIAIEMRLVTFSNGIGSAVLETLDPATFAFNSTLPTSFSVSTVDMVGSGAMDFSAVKSKDTNVNLGTSTLFSKSNTLPPDTQFDRGSAHSLFHPEKQDPTATASSSGFIVGQFVQFDPVSGLIFVAPRASGSLKIYDGAAVIAEWGQSFPAPTIFQDNDAYREAPISQIGTTISLVNQFCSVAGGIPAGFAGREADSVAQQDRRLFQTGSQGAGVAIVNQGTLAQDVMLWAEDIGLGGSWLQSNTSPVAGISAIRWPNAVPGQDGLFLVFLGTGYTVAAAAWAELVREPTSSPAAVAAAFSAVVAEMTVLFNNFASLEFAVSAIGRHSQFLTIIESA